MKLVIDLATNSIAGMTSDQNYSVQGYALFDMPEGFEETQINDYTLVDGVLTIDPTAALSRAKLQKIRAIRTHFDGVIQGIKATVANYEVQTWDTQRNELTMYLANSTNPTPYVDGLASARGETREVLFTKIKAKVDAMAALQGTQHALEKQVEVATTLAEVEAVKWA